MHTTHTPRRWQLLVAAAAVVAALTASVASPFAAGAQEAPEPEPSTEIAEPIAEQIAALQAEKADRTPAEAKVDSNLLYAAAEETGSDAVEGAPDLESTAVVDRAGRTEVDITAQVDADLLARIEDLGGEILVSVPGFDAVRAEMPIDAVVDLAADAAVRNVVPAGDAVTNAIESREDGQTSAASTGSVGAGINEAVATHGADAARGTYGIDGEGVKVCVLSDGVASLASRRSTGDLPAVDVLPGQAGSGDEGTAMLELIHDIAPGAELGFATAFGSQAGFAQNILALRADGCDVIVDDVSYFAEGAFQDDDVARAITQVKADGATYFTAAGNSGNLADGTSGTWQGDFQDSGASTSPLPPGLRVHGWGVGAASNPITDGVSKPITLQWADPLDRATNDYDLYLLDATGTSVVAASTTDQNGTQDPYERVTGSAGQRVVVTREAGAADRYLALYTNRGRLTYATGGASFGHNSSVDAISTAATPAAAAHQAGSPVGPNPGPHTAANQSETFSSDGPVRSFYGPDGHPLTPGDLSSTGGVVRTGVDLTAADGTTTTTPGFTRFFGTSAAAPNAAALAALALSADPTLTPAEVETALRASAIDIETPGDDPTTGAGIVMAPALLRQIGVADAPLVVPGARSVTQVTGDGDTSYEPGEVFDIRQELVNTGGQTAAAVGATLATTSSDVSLTRTTATYGSIAPGAKASPSASFRVKILRGCGCGTVLPFAITIADGDSTTSNRTNRFSLAVGSAGAPVRIAYQGPVVAIPDNVRTGVAVPLVVGDLGRIQDLTFSLDGTTCSAAAGATTVGLDHTYVGDLVLTLTSPSGTAVKMTVETTNDGNNYCKTVLSDAAATAFRVTPAKSAPFTGTYQPAAPLASFDGEDPEGTWTLKVADTYAKNVGSLRAFSLNISPTTCDQAANAAPTAASDTHSTPYGTPLVVPPDGVLQNDSDDDADPLVASVVDDVDHGTLDLARDGSFTYVPDPGFSGQDTFTYAADDGTGASAPAAVRIDVAPGPNAAPAAEPDTYAVTTGVTRDVPASGVLANDQDPDQDELAAVLADDVDHGSLELGDDGSFTYVPDPGYAGSDSFTYVAEDGEDASSPATVRLDVSRPNATPTGAIALSGPVDVVWSQQTTYSVGIPKISKTTLATGSVELRFEHTAGDTVTNTALLVPLRSNAAKFKTRDLPIGTTTIQAVYAGDGVYPSVVSEPITVEVVKAQTTTTVTSTRPTVATRGTAGFEARTARVAPALGSLAGTTTFTATAPGHAPVVVDRPTNGSGRATWTVKLPDGDWTVTAVYDDTDTWVGSSAPAPARQVVGTPPAPTGSSTQGVPASTARVSSERFALARSGESRRRRARRPRRLRLS